MLIRQSRKKQNISPTWKTLMKDVGLREPASFLDNVYLGCTQWECQISKDIVQNYRSTFESRISAGAEEKLPETTATRETWCRNDIFMVLWRGRSCKEKCGKILRTGEQNNRATVQSGDAMHGWSSIWRRRKWISWRTVQSLLTNCSEIFILVDLTFSGLWTNLLVRWRNGQKLVTNVWRVWSLTFITHVNTAILLWETQHNNAD